jgi:hypothetical protein
MTTVTRGTTATMPLSLHDRVMALAAVAGVSLLARLAERLDQRERGKRACRGHEPRGVASPLW